MNTFHYYPPRLLNNVVFVLLLAAFLCFLHAWGHTAWNWWMDSMGLGVFIVVVGFAFYLAVFWILGALYLLLNHYQKPLFLYRYKIQEVPPSRQGRKPKVPLSKSIKQVLINQFLGTWPYLFGVYLLLVWMGYDEEIPIPSWWVAILQLLGLVLVEDVLFFAMHHTMHRPWFFRRYHAKHHEYKESIAIATHYVHYVEHIFGNLTPVFAGVLLLQPHPFVVLFWIMIVVMNALHTHSGFAFPWMSYSVHHDWHHHYVNGSFSAVGLMDQLFGTDKAFDEQKRKYKASVL
ncbi:MAG: sterol desaturase family protein [Chitinophagales bacterium]|nr:sterol desaturase family protein [Chitinophagales bacterium]